MYCHAQSPIRIGIAGGGTDLPAWTKERVGRCLSLAVASYTHAVAITRDDGQVVASYNHLDRASCATEIGNGLVRESALLHGFEDGFEVHTLSEVSSRGSGLGVSSSIAVSLTACFDRLARLKLGPLSLSEEFSTKDQFAKDAWTVEIDRLRRPIGRQDHMAAAHGGLRLYEFRHDTSDVVKTFSSEDAAWLSGHLLLVQLPEGHDSRAILSQAKSASDLQVAYDSVSVAEMAIRDRDLLALGRVMKMGHASKKNIPGSVTSAVSSMLFEAERVIGVYGCKVAGAGGGGHLVVVYDGKTETLTRLRIATQLPVMQVKPDHGGVRSEGWL